jgi:glycine hydroxymethyltransferase
MILARERHGKAIDQAVFPGVQGGPLMHIIAAKAVCFLEAMTPEFAVYQKQILANAQVLASTLVAEGFHIISGGTDTHLMLVDIFSKGVRGREAETALHRAHMTTNKNAIPFDQNPPMNPSGIRLGTPAVTTRGLREPEMRQIGRWIAEVVLDIGNEAVIDKVKRQVLELADRFPLYAWKLEPTLTTST